MPPPARGRERLGKQPGGLLQRTACGSRNVREVGVTGIPTAGFKTSAKKLDYLISVIFDGFLTAFLAAFCAALHCSGVIPSGQ